MTPCCGQAGFEVERALTLMLLTVALSLYLHLILKLSRKHNVTTCSLLLASVVSLRKSQVCLRNDRLFCLFVELLQFSCGAIKTRISTNPDLMLNRVDARVV